LKAATSGRGSDGEQPRPLVAALQREPIELGRSETLRPGQDGTILCLGTLLSDCLAAADLLAADGLEVGVVNMRFAKPIDTGAIERALRDTDFVLTVEEGCLMGGFGSAVLETASDLGVDTSRLKRLGLPDRFIEHGERSELLSDLGLDPTGIATACRELAERGEGVNA
ncbi:MAG TPA: transketolase C-terminal domain-containing protein, partial [Pirellulaceae bacterium]|nr:transketolase C-terminal domain-containing protein [Pirellulaceae bacterium]